MKVALIGGGPCGLAFMHAMRTKEKEGVEIPEIVCFEKQADVGGLWNYSWRTGMIYHFHSNFSCWRCKSRNRSSTGSPFLHFSVTACTFFFRSTDRMYMKLDIKLKVGWSRAIQKQWSTIRRVTSGGVARLSIFDDNNFSLIVSIFYFY